MKRKISESEFMRRYGILCTALIALLAWSTLVWLTAERYTAVRVTEKLSNEYAHEYEIRMKAFVQEYEEVHTPTEDEQLAAQIASEADEIAKAIGTMSSKRQKLSMLWNILMRVDSPYYPDTVADVINQPDQWMFYKDSNPIREDDVELASEQLALWHSGRYPAGLSATFVYGEWSEHDYVLRDAWEKNYKTNYWRFPE